MKKLLLSGIAALFLATGAAHATDYGWEREFCLRKGELPPQELKKCIAFWRCVSDREAGKVKHC
jgi:hypothetical protein